MESAVSVFSPDLYSCPVELTPVMVNTKVPFFFVFADCITATGYLAVSRRFGSGKDVEWSQKLGYCE